MAMNLDWRRRKSAAYDLEQTSTARKVIRLPLWGRELEVYANANLSIYSAQRCNARCPFCVEELRPASRGRQRPAEPSRLSREAWFERLERVLDALSPLNPSVSITGGEPSLDPRLPALLELLHHRRARKRTLTTNGTGLARGLPGSRPIDHLGRWGLEHLNLSIAAPDPQVSQRLMRLPEPLPLRTLELLIQAAQSHGIQVRLSCVLLEEGTKTVADLRTYLRFARSVGANAVIFRQLMQTDPATVLHNEITRYSDQARVLLEPLLDQLSETSDFIPVTQVLGYYYYVEVWRHAPTDASPLTVVFEEAELGRLEAQRRERPGVVHELVYHPEGVLASTWQAWDGVLGPPEPAVPV